VFSTVRRFIKTAILFLFTGLAYGGTLLYRREILGIWPAPYQVSAHAHVVGIGFVMFLILGVALWLFPRPAKHDQRYRPERIGAAWWILAPATAVRFVAEAAGPGTPGDWLAWTILAAGMGQIVGLALYFHTMWPRIRPVGSHLREEKGEQF
jgi:heme/copper-type cytochrome/quinol oxidase subunit 1